MRGFYGNVDLGKAYETIPFSGHVKITPDGVHIEKLTVFDVFNVEGNIVLQPGIFLDFLLYCSEVKFSKILEKFDFKETEFIENIYASASMKLLVI